MDVNINDVIYDCNAVFWRLLLPAKSTLAISTLEKVSWQKCILMVMLISTCGNDLQNLETSIGMAWKLVLHCTVRQLYVTTYCLLNCKCFIIFKPDNAIHTLFEKFP